MINASLSPELRGPLSEAAWTLLRGGPAPQPGAVSVADPLSDDDLHLALYLCYEIHYRAVEGIDDRAEWSPAVIGFREELELPFEMCLREAFERMPTCEPIDVQLRRLIDEGEGPSLSSYLAHVGTREMFREFLMHRSVYHLKEADPHSFGIPRLRGRAKVAMLEIQHDEYGGGDPAWMHSALFERTMQGLDLDPTEGMYADRLPGITLAAMNLMSLFALHRRLRGALVGHLAAFEMTSCIPNRRYGDGLRRLGFDGDVTRYFDEHVEADAAHGAIAANDLAGSLLEDEPALDVDVIFGASCLLGLEARSAAYLIERWDRGESSLVSDGASLPIAEG
jgi:Iron-containing redox enzyme